MADVRYVSQKSIRQIYNNSQYPILVAGGKLRKEFLRNSHLKEPEKRGEPVCTHGQMIRYYDENGEWVLEVFQYLRPDKTIGAGGKPDPKRLRIGNTIYAVSILEKNK